MTAATQDPIISKSPAAVQAVTLPASLDPSAAETLCRELLEAIHLDKPLTLDGAEVERVSALSAQVLAAAARSARSRGLAFTLQSPSTTLTEAIAQLGLQQILIG